MNTKKQISAALFSMALLSGSVLDAAPQSQKGGDPEARRAALVEIVEAEDIGSDGLLAREEIANILRAIRERVSDAAEAGGVDLDQLEQKRPNRFERRQPDPDEAAERLMQRLDKEGSGVITVEAFLEAHDNMRKRIREAMEERQSGAGPRAKGEGRPGQGSRGLRE